MLQRVLRYLDPKGVARSAVRRWWWAGARNAQLPRAAERSPLVTCTLLADADLDRVAARCRELQQQTWRPFEVLVIAADDVARTLAERENVLALAAPAAARDPAASAAALAGDFVLEAEGAADPHLLAALVAALQADPARAEVRGRGGALDPHGPWRLCRAGAAARPDARPVTVVAPSSPIAPPPTDGPSTLRFDGDGERHGDLPYRWRSVLERDECRAFAADALLAERLALLSPRTAHAADDETARRSLAAAAAALATPAPLPARPAAPRPIVLQADDFTEGGMEQVVLDLAAALLGNGFAPRLLILGKQGTAAERARAGGLAVDRVAAHAGAYRDYLAQHRPQLVNAHYSTFGAEACAARGVPFVQTVHNMYAWFGPEHVAAYRAADAHTRAYVCVSNNAARYADLAMGLPPARMLVIPNGCDAGYLASDAHRAAAAQLRTELGLGAAARVLLNVASVQPPKGQHVLLGAFALVAARFPDAHLVVLGAAADDGYLRAQQREGRRLGLADRVHWVGRRRDVSAFHQLADALVQPSFFEGWSLAITEAVLAGLPVIATDVGGAVEQLQGTSGIVVPAAIDTTRLHRDTLMPLLADPCLDLQRRLAAAMAEVLARGGARSPLPAHWRLFLRDVAYARCAHAFHWFAAGGGARTARRWLAAESGR